MAIFPWCEVPYDDWPTTGVIFTPAFKTQIVTAKSEREQRRAWLTSPRRRVKMEWKQQNNSKTKLQELYDFFCARKGKYESFAYFDWDVSKTWTDEPVGTGDGVTTVFNVPFRSGASSISYKVAGTPTAGTTATGGTNGRMKVTFGAAPANSAAIITTFTGQLYLPVRFDIDEMPQTLFEANLYEVGCELIEVIGE